MPATAHFQNSTKLKYIIVCGLCPHFCHSLSLSLSTWRMRNFAYDCKMEKGLLLLHLQLSLQRRRLTENNDRRILAWQSVNVSVELSVCV